MRVLQIFGAALIAVGLYVLIESPQITTDRNLFRFGEFEVTLTKGQGVPAGAGWTAIGVGVLLMAAGSRRTL